MQARIYSLVCIVLFQFGAIAQMERSASPIAYNLDEFTYNTYDLPTINVEEMMPVDVFRDQFKAYPYRFARAFNVALNHNNPITPSNPWTWIPLDGGAGIWIISIECPNALSLSLTFEKFDLEKGVSMVIYNENLEEVIGQLTYSDNNIYDKLATVPLSGNRIFLELYIPANKEAEVEIGKVACAYKETGVFNSTEACQVDVTCEENETFTSQLSSVVNILTNNGTEFSTGVLINSNSYISKPYVITSNRNLYGDPATWSFLFNYKSESCEEGGINDKYLVSCGAEIVMESEDSELVLLELFDTPSVDWDTFYNGWNRSEVPPDEYFTLHHAYGGVTNMAEGNSAIIETTLNGKDVWQIDSWGLGRTDPGCLGAPLFNEQGLVTGFFIGGDIRCNDDVLSAHDYFVPFYSCWNEFKNFLDPQNDSPAALVGRDPVVEPTNSKIVNDQVALFPVPADDFIYIFNGNDEVVKFINVYDAQGRFLELISLNDQSQKIDVSHISRGWYIFEVHLSSIVTSRRVLIN